MSELSLPDTTQEGSEGISSAADAATSATSTTTATDAVSTVTDPVVSATAPVADAGSAATDAATSAAGSSAATDAVSTVTDPVVSATAPVADAGSAATDAATSAAGSSAATDAVSTVTDPVVSATAPVVDAAAGAAEWVGDAATTVTDPLVSATAAVVDSAAGAAEWVGDAATTVTDPVVWLPHVVDLPFYLPEDDMRLFTTMAFVVGSLAVSARAARAAGEYTAPAQVILTNVRLIPCAVGDAVNRSAAVATIPVQRALNGFGSPTAIADAASRAVIDPVRKGFTLATSDDPSRTRVDGASDSRLLMQIGTLLGAVYVAFLTVWFWATRTRLERRY